MRILRFEELEAEGAFDAVWAHAALLHVPAPALADVLGKVRRALKSSGWFFASFKSGDGPGRDSLGRYYNFPSESVLRAAYAEAGPWLGLDIERVAGGGYDGVAREWLMCLAVKR